MTVGGDTFIHDMLQRCGFENVFARSVRYPALSVEQITEAACDAILLSVGTISVQTTTRGKTGKDIPGMLRTVS
jgi:ABC-type Fe3+-hydroxamate transport system substrate-binding protein